MITIARTVAVAAVGTLTQLPVFDVAESPGLMAYQTKCSHLFVRFVDNVHRVGPYSVVIKEAQRPKITAMEYAARGIGIANSLHIDSLAYDIALLVGGKYSQKPEDHVPLGLLWEEMGKVVGVPTAWGGRFGDSVHFSCAHDGRK